MRTIYIDADYKCYTAPAEGRRAVETNAFDGKCDSYIEGYRYVPAGENCTRPSGTVFTGEMVAPCKPWDELNAAQRAYERQQLEEANAKNAELLETMAAMVEEVYESDLAVFEEV